ncbi:MAG: type VI secretion system-associated FHA domain protein TagH [Gammaproteobacteria bacterium]|nr:MAG: type VI secretion system-associated FHA domain protein TagH [Gammaproteobacteria bacterium]
MPLVLTVVRQPEGANLTETRMLFDEAGGTLGRSVSSTWSLPDPSRFVSSQHASIRYENGDFYLVDTSTNGVFVNTSNSPLGTGNQVRLQQGDKLYLGEYEIHVEFDQPGSAAAMSADDFDQWLDPSTDTANEVAGDGIDLLTPEQELLDPLAALDKANGHQDQWQGASLADNADIAQQSFVPPNPIPDSSVESGATAPASAVASGSAGVIPDDWDLDDLLAGDPSPADSTNSGADDIDALLEGTGYPGEPAGEDVQPRDELDAFLGLDTEPPTATQDPAAVEPDIAEPVAVPEPKVEVPESVITGAVPSAAAAAPSQSACDELIRSLGLDPARMNDHAREHFQQVLADTLRETVSGMMQVLGARNTIKNEFRMNVTMIQPVENNPLKFSPNTDEALRNMFASQTNAYLPGTVAIKEGFQDIADHQVAVIAGMRAAFRSLLKRFDPNELQLRFDHQHQAHGFLATRKGKYWEAYSEFYRHLTDNMDDAFQDLFGEDFAEAYEQQMARLEATRNKQN